MRETFNGREFVANGDGAWIATTTHTPDAGSDRQCIRFVFNRNCDPAATRRLNLWVSDALSDNASAGTPSRMGRDDSQCRAH